MATAKPSLKTNSISQFTRPLKRFAIAGLALLLLCTTLLVITRNSVENDIVQRAASDLPLLKNRWPQFKKAIEDLREPIIAALAAPGPLEVSPSLSELMRKITDAHSFMLVKSNEQAHIGAHIEVIYFERGSVRPTVWKWAPNIDTGLTATELQTRISLQQLEQTELITAHGLMPGNTTPDSITDERRALVFFYLHTESKQYETLIKVLLRSSQALALLTTLLIALWIYASTGRSFFGILIIFMALVGLVIYSSLVLKALSLRTVLTMLITLQFGASANRAVDYASLSVLAGAGYGLLLMSLMHRPTGPSCPECNRHVNEDFRFCPHCNFVLKRNCARCAEPVDTRWNYCPSCSEDI